MSAHITKSHVEMRRFATGVGVGDASMVWAMGVTYPSVASFLARQRVALIAPWSRSVAPRRKKFIALIALLPGLAIYLLLAAMIGERIPNIAILQILYYVAAGVAWAFPTQFLLKWAEKDQSQNGT
jgi:hypothetical protein